MRKIAFLFAGQGAQTPGMGQSLKEASSAANAVFNMADRIRPGTSAQCFSGTAEALASTINTQPCVFSVGLAAARALAEKGVVAKATAGFSLGEMAALSFAGAFDDDIAFSLVCKRAELMQQANEETAGAMAAVLRLQDAQVEAICTKFKQIYPVNYNCDGQLVVAGAKDEIPAFCAAVKKAGGIAKLLSVGGGFHSPFMASASRAFHQVLTASPIHQPALPVYANLNAQPYAATLLEETLAKQMQNPVLWKQTITAMVAEGFNTFVELGPGKTLSGFVKRISPNAAIHNVQDAESLAITAEILTLTEH